MFKKRLKARYSILIIAKIARKFIDVCLKYKVIDLVKSIVKMPAFVVFL